MTLRLTEDQVQAHKARLAGLGGTIRTHRVKTTEDSDAKRPKMGEATVLIVFSLIGWVFTLPTRVQKR